MKIFTIILKMTLFLLYWFLAINSLAGILGCLNTEDKLSARKAYGSKTYRAYKRLKSIGVGRVRNFV